MATQSVQQDKRGPDWPLGLIVVATPGTPVGIMSLVDPSAYNDPGQATLPQSDEYTPSAQQIMFQGFKAGASNGLQNNTGNVYVMRKGIGGAGNHNDYGSLVAVVPAGNTLFLASSAMNNNVFSPYRYYIDSDNAGDSCLVTLIIQ